MAGAGCEKDEAEGAPAGPPGGGTPTTRQRETGGDGGPESAAGEGGQQESRQEPAGEQGSDRETAEKVKLNLDLPDPMFVGTPTDFETDNLDPNTGEPRGDVFVPAGTRLISVNRPVTSSDPGPIIGELSQVTDGVKTGYEGNYVALAPGKHWVQVDLKDTYRIEAVVIWHYHSQARVYRDVIVQVSDDPGFLEGMKTVFNNDHDNSSGMGIGDDYEYVETYEGKVVKTDGAEGCYVRLYSNGSTTDQLNHYTEVEVYGRPVAGGGN